jgi:hypothetical protein
MMSRLYLNQALLETGNWSLFFQIQEMAVVLFNQQVVKHYNNTQGVVNCNISFCFGSLTLATTTGTYNVATTSIDVDNCTGNYSFNGAFLEVSHFCIEPCGERYIRIN